MKKRILITGGAGFIGHHTANALLRDGHFVRVLDNLDPQIHNDSPHLLRDLSPDIELIVGDVRSFDDMKRSLRGIDTVFHFAAQTGVGQSMYELGSYFDTNVNGTAILWEAIIKDRLDVEKIILASSRAVYGEGAHKCEKCGIVAPKPRSSEQLCRYEWEVLCPQCNRVTKTFPTPETHPLKPLSGYGLTKKMQEEICTLGCTSVKIPVIILRYFNVYGPGQAPSNPYTGIAAIFCTRLLSGNKIEIYEDGKMIRDFINIRDVVLANLLAVEKEVPGVFICNVGSGEKISVLQLADAIRKRIDPESDLLFSNKFRKGDIRSCYADVAVANTEFDSPRRVEFAKGMDELIKWASVQKVTDHYNESLTEMKIHGILEK